jgi:hypothetical protein
MIKILVIHLRFTAYLGNFLKIEKTKVCNFAEGIAIGPFYQCFITFHNYHAYSSYSPEIHRIFS